MGEVPWDVERERARVVFGSVMAFRGVDMRHSIGWVAAFGLAGAAGVVSGAQGAPDAKSITPAMVALGDSLYHGRVGGALCQICHGPEAKGINPLGPSLVDAEWLHGDGSYAFIVEIVEKGIEKPKKAPAPMPPRGGGQLTPAQVLAVSAYVYSLNHKDGGR